ncbi:B-box type zinc finger protein with CCT domain-containing protein [Artemisia annua]|uniref:B-box type zinc finger protein with CCT domain-containing protein n=1 Tax=Artemisia annua TaxID=35608 RepID=A0A2U1QCZ2_ARTAN|nr:B-box type zinc finger protein with CCT domain-containing protein [Artemisia annua]
MIIEAFFDHFLAIQVGTPKITVANLSRSCVPDKAPLDYLLAGYPALVSNLWIVTNGGQVPIIKTLLNPGQKGPRRIYPKYLDRSATVLESQLVLLENDSNCEQEMGLMSITDNKNDQDLPVDDVTQQVNAKDSTTQKIVGTKGGDQFINDRFYDDFTMDEDDLSIENYEELFGEGHNDSKHLFAKAGIDSLFAAKDTSVAESVCHGAYAAKVS